MSYSSTTFFTHKYSQIRKCELCGKRYATLPVTLILSESLRPHYCNACGNIIFNLIQKQKKLMREEAYATDVEG